MKYPFIEGLSDKELNFIYKELKELLEHNKEEIEKELNSHLSRLNLIKRDNWRVFTKDETELYDYLHKYGWDVDIDEIYRDYFKYMNQYQSLKDEYDLLQEKYKEAKEFDVDAYDYGGSRDYYTSKSPNEIKKIEMELSKIETKLKKLQIPKMVIVIFRRAFIYDLTDTFIEIKKEKKLRRESKKKR